MPLIAAWLHDAHPHPGLLYPRPEHLMGLPASPVQPGLLETSVLMGNPGGSAGTPVADGRVKGLPGEAVGGLQRVRCKVLACRRHLQAAGELIATRQTSQSSSIM